MPTSQTSQLHVRPQTVRVRAHGGNKYTLKNTDLKINKYMIDLALFQCPAHFSHSEVYESLCKSQEPANI